MVTSWIRRNGVVIYLVVEDEGKWFPWQRHADLYVENR